VKPVLNAPGYGLRSLKQRCDRPLSNFAFNFNLRRYITGESEEEVEERVARERAGRKAMLSSERER